MTDWRTNEYGEFRLNFLSPAELVKIAEDVDATGVTMNAWTFADIRKFGRDSLDLEKDTAELKKGNQGYIGDVKIMVSRDVTRGHIAVDTENGKMTHCRWTGITSEQCDNPDCVIEIVMES